MRRTAMARVFPTQPARARLQQESELFLSVLQRFCIDFDTEPMERVLAGQSTIAHVAPDHDRIAHYAKCAASMVASNNPLCCVQFLQLARHLAYIANALTTASIDAWASGDRDAVRDATTRSERASRVSALQYSASSLANRWSSVHVAAIAARTAVDRGKRIE